MGYMSMYDDSSETVLRDLLNQQGLLSAYDRLKDIDLFTRKDTDMPYLDRYYTCDVIAAAVLEAYSKGITFDSLLKENSQVRVYWKQLQIEKNVAEQAQKREQERQRKLAEKRAIEKAKKEEVMAKLTQEELEAFGLVKKPRKVTK